MINLIEKLKRKAHYQMHKSSKYIKLRDAITLIAAAREEIISQLHEPENCMGKWKTKCSACEVIDEVMGEK